MHGTLGGRMVPMVAILAYLAVGVLYAGAVPPWEAPDEPWHLAYAEALAAGRLPTSADTYEAHQPPLYYLWPAYALRVLDVARIPRAEDNPEYPFAPSAYLHPAGDPGAPVLRLSRTFSGLLGALVVALAWAVARAAVPDWPGCAATAAIAVALLPQFAFVAHSVSNDALAAAAGALTTYGLVCWARRGGYACRATVTVGAGLALGLLVKLNVLALTPAVAVAAMYSLTDRRRALGRLAPAWLLAGGLVVLAGGALWLTVPETAAALATDAVERAVLVRAELVAPIPLAQQVVRLLVSAWGRFGWLNVDMPWTVTLAAGLLAAVGLVGLVRGRESLGPATRRAVVVSAVACVSVFAAAVKNLVADPQPQGRLMFPALAAAMLLLALGWRLVTRARWARALAPAVAAALVAVNLATTLWLLPAAYAESREAAPKVDARVVAVPWRVVATLGEPEAALRQTFHVYRPGFRRVAVAVAQSRGSGWLEVRLLDSSGAVLAASRIAPASIAPNSWFGLDVGPLANSAGRDYVLELRLTGAGSVSFWGTREDVYPEGDLWVGGRRSTDLMMLTMLATE